jgi:hypothetical protein
MATTASTQHRHHSATTHEPPPGARAAGIVAALTVVVAIIALAFALPAARSAPHDVPIGIAGPQAADGQLADRLEQRAPGAFAVTYYPGADALRDAIRDRDVYGGIALGPDGAQLLIATGASPAIAQLLTQIGTGMSQQTAADSPVAALLPAGIPLRTDDLAPPTEDDPRGAGLAASALPITLAGLLPGIALVIALRREVWTRLAAVLVFAPLAGYTVAALLRYVFGSIEDNLAGVGAGLTLGVLAAGLAVLGLGSLFGRAGLALGALLAVLVGNPLSGLTSAPEMLPAGWGQFGQWLPQGATATLLRSTAYFSGHGATAAIVVLTCWAVAGTALVVVAALRRPKPVAE